MTERESKTAERDKRRREVLERLANPPKVGPVKRHGEWDADDQADEHQAYKQGSLFPLEAAQ